MSLLASICVLFEVIKYWTEALTPRTMLFTHAIKAICAFAILALDIVAYIIPAEVQFSLLGIVMGSLLLYV